MKQARLLLSDIWFMDYKGGLSILSNILAIVKPL